jgi:hypothetical protein
MKPAVLLLTVIAGCSSTVFDTEDCFPLQAARDGDNDPPWRVDEGDPGGPRFVDGSVEWLTVEGNDCRFDLEIRMKLAVGEGTVSSAEVAKTILFAPGDFDRSPAYVFVVDDDAAIDDDGDVIDIVVSGCAAEIEGLESRQAALFLKLSDADGRESDAFCARTFAKVDADLPARNAPDQDEGA